MTDDEREEARIRYQNTVALTCPPGHYDIKMLLRWLDAASLALSGAQAEIERRRLLAAADHETIAKYVGEIALRDAEIARLQSHLSVQHQKLQDWLDQERGHRAEIARLRAIVDAPTGANAREIAAKLLDELRIPTAVNDTVNRLRIGDLARAIEAAEARGRAAGFADGAAQMREAGGDMTEPPPMVPSAHDRLISQSMQQWTPRPPAAERSIEEAYRDGFAAGVQAERIRSLPNRETGQ